MSYFQFVLYILVYNVALKILAKVDCIIIHKYVFIDQYQEFTCK